MRFPFFETYHEALAAAIPDEGAFTHVIAHIWSGGAVRRDHKASMDAHAVALRADVAEDGFLTSMARLSMDHPYKHAAGATVGPGEATRSFSRRGDPLLGTAAPKPPSHAFSAGTAEPPASYSPLGTPTRPGTAAAARAAAAAAATTPGVRDIVSVDGLGDRGKRHAHATDIAYKYASSPSIFTGGDGYTGGVGSAMRGSPRYSAGAPGIVPLGSAPVPASGDADLDAVLSQLRDTLLQRGVKGLFRLVRALEDAANSVAVASGVAASAHGPTSSQLHVPLPSHVFASVIRDASFGLSPRQLDTLAGKLAFASAGGVSASGGGAARGIDCLRFLELLRGGLAPARVEVVLQAYRKLSGAAGGGVPALDDIRMAYRSAAHPDVAAMKRSEEAVLREFLETFAGPTYSDEATGHVPIEGFLAYYADLGFYVADDTHFAVILFDTWDLAAADAHDAAAGKPTTVFGGLADGSRAVAHPRSSAAVTSLLHGGGMAASDRPATAPAFDGGAAQAARTESGGAWPAKGRGRRCDRTRAH